MYPSVGELRDDIGRCWKVAENDGSGMTNKNEAVLFFLVGMVRWRRAVSALETSLDQLVLDGFRTHPVLYASVTPETWVQSRRLRSLCGVAGEPAIVTRLGFGLNSQLHWYRPIIVQLTVGLQLTI